MLEGGYTQESIFHQTFEVLPILFQQLEFERVGNLVRSHPGFGLRFEAADDQPADLLLEIGVAVGVTQDRKVGMDTGYGLGDDVEVLG